MIQVLFRCRCMKPGEEITVPVRPRPEIEDAAHWVGQVVAKAVGEAHLKRSPWCREQAMEYVKIPHPENAPHIGAEPRLQS